MTVQLNGKRRVLFAVRQGRLELPPDARVSRWSWPLAAFALLFVASVGLVWALVGAP